ncbi:unnamed protein product, partial [Urochloa humidicola]
GGRRDGVAAGDVKDGNGDEHVQHGPLHGAAGEDHRVRRPGGAGDGAALRRRPARHARRRRRVRSASAAGDVLRFAIIQAALPQSIASFFVFAKEYGLHADVLSTAVIFGTL